MSKEKSMPVASEPSEAESRAVSVPPSIVKRRGSAMAARGEPAIWITGLALKLCVVLIVVLLGVIVYQGAVTFWPRPIELVTLKTGVRFAGTPMATESYSPGVTEESEILALKAAGGLPHGSLDGSGKPIRRLYRVGNRDIGQEPFRWVPLYQVDSVTRPDNYAVFERVEWNIWIGEPDSILRERTITGGEELLETVGQSGVTKRELISHTPGGEVRLRESEPIASTPAEVWSRFDEVHAEARKRAARSYRLREHELGAVSAKQESLRLSLRGAEMRLADAGAGKPFPFALFALCAAGGVGVLVASGFAQRVLRRKDPSRSGPRLIVRNVLNVIGAMLLLAALLKNPFTNAPMTADRLESMRAQAEIDSKKYDHEREEILKEIRAIEQEDREYRIVIKEATAGRAAPIRQTEPNELLMVSQIVRAVPANRMGLGGKLGVYFDRWREFLADPPREANADGGIYPVIFGTVLLTMVLCVLVVPLGVVAALYLREYAKQGPLTSILRIAINNLAGVPSIVYGVFGLGFFCYAIGGYIDAGPEKSQVLDEQSWWVLAGGFSLIVIAALSLGFFSTPVPGSPVKSHHRILKVLMIGAWLTALLSVVTLFSTTPYFSGFFSARLPTPTFGNRGLLWAALTLALLTLPVVIVATEEAISAVPRTMREGSYGCGASKWQTVRRIVLPGAMPGIMTGAILAMARGAGEVAPLMLVGAMKLAPDPPLTGEFPFLHLDRAFMHLGFHIYDLGFQSADAEAARPLVWSTTLVLLVVVASLNLTAIRIRASLRARLAGGTF